VVEITPLVKQVGPETRALDRFQELLGDDGVGIDVGPVERRDQAAVDGERLHDRALCLNEEVNSWERSRPEAAGAYFLAAP
jgi:hypothetical protein